MCIDFIALFSCHFRRFSESIGRNLWNISSATLIKGKHFLLKYNVNKRFYSKGNFRFWDFPDSSFKWYSVIFHTQTHTYTQICPLLTNRHTAAACQTDEIVLSVRTAVRLSTWLLQFEDCPLPPHYQAQLLSCTLIASITVSVVR